MTASMFLTFPKNTTDMYQGSLTQGSLIVQFPVLLIKLFKKWYTGNYIFLMLYEWLHILEEETQEESCARIHPHIQIRTICFDANFVPRKPGCLRFSQIHGTILFLLVIEVNFSLHYTYFIKKIHCVLRMQPLLHL